MYNPLPHDFRDRPHRWWYNLLVFLKIQTVKPVCCEKFRKEGVMQACKGCATRYDKQSSDGFYRCLGRHARMRVPKTALPSIGHRLVSDDPAKK
jgi:hypothetical protein